MKDNPTYHISTSHGKNKLHKFVNKSANMILKKYPIDITDRRIVIKNIVEEYKAARRPCWSIVSMEGLLEVKFH